MFISGIITVCELLSVFLVNTRDNGSVVRNRPRAMV